MKCFWFVKDPNGYSCVQSDQNDRRLNETVFDLVHSRILNPKNLTIELGQAHDSYHAEFIFDNDGTDVSPLCVLKGTLGLVFYQMIRSADGSISYGPYDMGHMALTNIRWKPWKGFGGYETTADPVKLKENLYGCDFFGFFDDEHDLTFQVQIQGNFYDMKIDFLIIDFRRTYWSTRNKNPAGTFVE